MIFKAPLVLFPGLRSKLPKTAQATRKSIAALQQKYKNFSL
jgi:hypothetical protein